MFHLWNNGDIGESSSNFSYYLFIVVFSSQDEREFFLWSEANYRVTKLTEVLNYIEELIKNQTIRNVVVLPPEAGDWEDQDSQLEDGKIAYEPAEEFEIETNRLWRQKEPDLPPRKRQFVGKSKWIESETSDKPIKFGKQNLSLILIDEADSSPLTIWSIISQDIVMTLVYKTNLYANSDKIEYKFGIDGQEMKRYFLAFFWYLGIIHNIMKTSICQLNKIWCSNCQQCNE